MLSLLMILCVFPAMSSTNVEQFGLNIVTSFEQQLASLSLSDPYRNPLEQHVAMLKRFRRSTEASESESVVEGIRSKLFSIAKPVASPIAVFLGGGMAAGKSSITKEWQNLFSPADGFVLIDVDAIMMELPDYKKVR